MTKKTKIAIVRKTIYFSVETVLATACFVTGNALLYMIFSLFVFGLMYQFKD